MENRGSIRFILGITETQEIFDSPRNDWFLLMLQPKQIGSNQLHNKVFVSIQEINVLCGSNLNQSTAVTKPADLESSTFLHKTAT